MRAQWVEKGAVGKGRKVIAKLPDETLIGRVSAIAEQGAWLQVEIEDPGIAANLGYNGAVTFTWRSALGCYLPKFTRLRKSNCLRLMKEPKRRGP